METILAIVVGILFAAGTYLITRHQLIKLLMGLALLSHASNLLIFTVGGLTPEKAPLIAEGQKSLLKPYADPLPQALILTAIVISFAVFAFAVVLVYRTHRTIDIEDIDHMKEDF